MRAEEAAGQFRFAGKTEFAGAYGNGHINDTFLLREEGGKRYILQKMNHNIFHNTAELMENIVRVTSHLRSKIAAAGGDPERETLSLLETNEGKSYYTDPDGNGWRVYRFIEDAFCFDFVEKPQDFYESAVAFGHFQRLLSDFPAESLHETIPDFHNTKKRLEAFRSALEEDRCGRAASVAREAEFILEREETACELGDMLKAGRLPLRVTHNDTKLNNIMIDNKTRRGICVIDLDTVMPGLSAHDFGDSIRFGASTAAEDETDLNRVSCDLSLYELYTKGFVKGCNGSLTAEETAALPLGAKVMTFECGMRFLADYLQGDTYFKIHREAQNLDRCRTQLKLVADMEQKWDAMREIALRQGGLSS